GRTAATISPAHSRDLIDALYSIVASAQGSVDILSLAAFPDGEFHEAIKNALAALARTGRTVTVRMAFGQFGLAANQATLEYLKKVTAGVPSGAKLKVYVAQVVPKAVPNAYSWNHAKIVAADGAVALVGGHNWWSAPYLDKNRPIFDLSMKVEGPAAASAQKFANRLWEFIAANNKHIGESWKTFSNHYDAATGTYGQDAAGQVSIPAVTGMGDVPILAVADPGYGLPAFDSLQASRRAMLYFFRNAKRSIYLSQQDLVSNKFLGDPNTIKEVFTELAKFVVQRGGMLGIVISDRYATDVGGVPYSEGFDAKDILEWLERWAVEAGIPRGEALEDALQQRVFVGTMRFHHAESGWPGATPLPIGNHAKFWMVDERVFYVGSDNLYPYTHKAIPNGISAALQEYGYVVDHAPSAAHLVRTYWRPVVEFSLNSAVSGLAWGVGPERLTWRPRPANAPPPAKRIGPLLTDDSTSEVFTLSGSGELIVRTYDAKTRAWKGATVSRPRQGATITIAGPAVPQQHAAIAGSREGDVFQRSWSAAAGWQWQEHERCPGGAVTALGPLWQHPGEDDAYRFFAVANGSLYDRHWRVSQDRWLWQHHPELGSWRVAAIGPLLYDTAQPEPFKLFLLGEDGTVQRLEWSRSSGYKLYPHGNHGARILSLGPIIADRGTEHPIKVYAVGEGGALCELVYIAAEKRWTWWTYETPSPIVAFGPAFLSHAYGDRLAKKFVVAADGQLWEHFWTRRGNKWDWERHGLAGGAFRIAGIGPQPPEPASPASPRVFITTEGGRFFERRWLRRDREWIWTTQWERDDLPPVPRRIGEVVEQGIDGKPTVYTLSGSGHLTARVLDGGSWTVRAESLPPDNLATAIGPAMGNATGMPHIVLLNTFDSPAIARWKSDVQSWHWTPFSLPDGSRVAAFGPFLLDARYRHPFRFFAATEKGNLVDVWTDARNVDVWHWQTHGQPAGGRVRSIGGVLLDNAANRRIRLFVSAANGSLYERYYDGAAWHWEERGAPGVSIAGAGPLLAYGTAIRVFVLLAGGRLTAWQLDAGKAEWKPYDDPRSPIAALGPAFLRDTWESVFVRTASGALWESRFDWNTKNAVWQQHVLPDSKQRVTAIGPRTLDSASVSTAVPRVIVSTDTGALLERRRVRENEWEWHDVSG
ncbi:MAG TPA: hypothetical protein VKB93_19820, partial [Thermoanaerobaculia bacterium]|nr:hypothetical protein [Thermoanaerobaculia bacterium]